MDTPYERCAGLNFGKDRTGSWPRSGSPMARTASPAGVDVWHVHTPARGARGMTRPRGVSAVGIEATGQYTKPVWYVVDERGLASHGPMKAATGRGAATDRGYHRGGLTRSRHWRRPSLAREGALPVRAGRTSEAWRASSRERRKRCPCRSSPAESGPRVDGGRPVARKRHCRSPIGPTRGPAYYTQRWAFPDKVVGSPSTITSRRFSYPDIGQAG